MGFKPLCKSEGSAYFLDGDPNTRSCLGVSLDFDRNNIRKPSPYNPHIAFTIAENNFKKIVHSILNSGAKTFKENTSPGTSLYFLDPDEHKI